MVIDFPNSDWEAIAHALVKHAGSTRDPDLLRKAGEIFNRIDLLNQGAIAGLAADMMEGKA